MPSKLHAKDIADLQSRGLTVDEIERQLELLRRPPPKTRLARPCVRLDGIKLLERNLAELECRWREEVAGRSTKFVPASGMASRMFAFLSAFRGEGSATPDALRARASEGHTAARQTLELLESVDRLPMIEELERVAALRTGKPVQSLRHDDPDLLIELLVGDTGLNLGGLPKGLIPFHRYEAGPRTAFEEHFFEGASYLSDGSTPARFHFTVSPDHQNAFRNQLETSLPAMERRLRVAIETGFSVQEPATETVAVGEDGKPLRDDSGALVFRAGGHGSLLRNLQNLASEGHEIVFIKNIDNIAVESRHPLVARWKRVLAGYATELRSRAFGLLDRLESGATGLEPIMEAERFIRTELAVELRSDLETLPPARRGEILRDRLDRPLRICGVVVNRGEPGGGPFWIEREGGTVDGQIVEAAQIDRKDPGQLEIWEASTHFNPVDLVCVLQDRCQRPYDLSRFVDQSTYLVSEKTLCGRPIRVLERPGLWNGSMAGWNTAFVEVPEETFTPVKTLRDLLRPAHRA